MGRVALRRRTWRYGVQGRKVEQEGRGGQQSVHLPSPFAFALSSGAMLHGTADDDGNSVRVPSTSQEHEQQCSSRAGFCVRVTSGRLCWNHIAPRTSSVCRSHGMPGQAYLRNRYRSGSCVVYRRASRSFKLYVHESFNEGVWTGASDFSSVQAATETQSTPTSGNWACHQSAPTQPMKHYEATHVAVVRARDGRALAGPAPRHRLP
ncbi:hypothetical protein C8T65DRAFT_81581 [Cerioporus squamosus]|nr:hypothetical protein C8T65DRAFT_81581 [Cerioporus squamosus]